MSRYSQKSTKPLSALSEAEERDQLLAYAFQALGARALSETELRRKLSQRTENTELITSVLARVKELGYQKDEDVARIENNKSGIGSFRVRQALKRRGVSETLIEETLETRDPDQETADAMHLLQRRWLSFKRKKNPRGSAYAFLSRRGFSGSIIWAALETLENQHEPLATNYSKLSNSKFDAEDAD